MVAQAHPHSGADHYSVEVVGHLYLAGVAGVAVYADHESESVVVADLASLNAEGHSYDKETEQTKTVIQTEETWAESEEASHGPDGEDVLIHLIKVTAIKTV